MKSIVYVSLFVACWFGVDVRTLIKAVYLTLLCKILVCSNTSDDLALHSPTLISFVFPSSEINRKPQKQNIQSASFKVNKSKFIFFLNFLLKRLLILSLYLSDFKP